MKKNILVVFLALAHFFSHAQLNFGVSNRSSAETSPRNELGINVEGNSGVANITIPLYYRNFEGIDVGVSLNYNTKGIRLDQLSSVVGLGWTLNSGASITRVIKGLPDELYLSSISFSDLRNGYWHRSNSNLLPSDPSAGQNIVNISSGYVPLESSFNFDTQIDQFILSFNGRLIKFSINAENEIVTIPQFTNLKINRIINGSVVSTFPKMNVVNTLEFEVIDEGGNRFLFEEGDVSKVNATYSEPVKQSAPSADFVPINWVIKKITTYTGQVIEYEYFQSNLTKVATDVSQSVLFLDPGQNMSYSDCNYSTLSHDLLKYNFFEGHYKLIKKINYPDVELVFNYLNEGSSTKCRCDVKYSYALKEIEIKERKNSWSNSFPSFEQKLVFDTKYFDANQSNNPHIQFRDHSYFNVVPSDCNPSYSSPTNNSEWDIFGSNLSLRLALIAIHKESNGITELLYNFEYYPLPNAHQMKRLSPHKDFWGYPAYNGMGYSQISSSTPIFTPMYTTPYGNYGVDRDASPTQANNATSGITWSDVSLGNMIKSISNQSNGKTEFTYDNNYVLYPSGVKRILPQLKVKEINKYPGLDDLSSSRTTYEYEELDWQEPLAIDLTSYNFHFKDLFIRGAGGLRCPTSAYTGTEVSNWYQGSFNENLIGYKRLIKRNFRILKSGSNVNSKQTSKVIYHYSTLHSKPSEFTILSSTVSGQSYNSCPNNDFILASPPNGSSLYGSNSEYFSPYNSAPNSEKQYVLDWALGLPYKVEYYNFDNFKEKEVVSEYDINLKSLNVDNWLNQNFTYKFYPINNPMLTNSSTDITRDFYFPYTGSLKLAKETVTNFLSNTSQTKYEELYEYDMYNNVTKTIRKNINPLFKTELVNVYSHLSSPSAYPFLNNINSSGLITLIGTEYWKQIGTDPPRLFEASYSTHDQFNGKIRSKGSFKLKSIVPLTQNQFSSGGFDFVSALSNSNIPNFKLEDENILYDYFGDLLEFRKKDISIAQIWDTYIGKQTAIIDNAKYSECAYSSFESSLYVSAGQQGQNTNKGNFSFNCDGIIYSKFITGKRSYQLSYLNFITSQTSLINGKKYILKYWKLGGGSFVNLNYGQSSLVPILVKEVAQQNDIWQLWQCEFIAQPNINLTIQGNAIIDEVKLHPLDATMQTSTYDPILGITSEINNRNDILYYEYDGFGRLYLTRDIYKNIIEKKKFGFKTND